MNYGIVATLGPAADGDTMWQRLLDAGATAFRLNTSHFELGELDAWLDRIESFFAGPAGRRCVDAVPVILDLQASKWRIGAVETVELAAGRTVELVLGAGPDLQCGAAASVVLPIPHPDFFVAAESSTGEIALNDAKVILQIERVDGQRIGARVMQEGEISTGKGITLVGSSYRKEQLNDKDRRVIELARPYGFVRFALSYVKDAAEMRNYRDLLGASRYLIAKLERASALEEANEIAGTADELWICRGDLGAELGLAAMAEKLLRFFANVQKIPGPVYLAGQVLEHMNEHPTPTRSEISYLYEALRRGVRGIVLSDETAVGAYPVESCRTAALFRSDRANQAT